jgi:hypothetical protein
VPEKKEFDLVVYYYGDDPDVEIDADFIVKRKGLKFENFHHYLTHQDISQYDAIWVVDDDIVLDTGSINKMFKLFVEYELKLAQPSFSKGSKTPWKVTKNDPECVIRYTNFVENGAVIFSNDVVPLLKETFKEAVTGFGVDFIWPSLLGFPADGIAVIDAVICQHPIVEYSALDEVVPRSLHKEQGIQLLKKYELLSSDWEPTKANPNPIPYPPREYTRVLK